jgi:predicted porin
MFKKLLATAILSACAFSSMAASPSFNYVEGGYVTDLNSDLDFDGWEIKGSFELNNDLYMLGSYQRLNTDIGFIDVDANIFSAGLGYKVALTHETALFTELEYINVNIDAKNFASDSENGYQFGVGARTMVSDALELKAAAYYQDVEGSEQFIKVGAAYQLNDAMSVYMDVDTDFDDSQLMTGLRFTF